MLKHLINQVKQDVFIREVLEYVLGDIYVKEKYLLNIDKYLHITFGYDEWEHCYKWFYVTFIHKKYKVRITDIMLDIDGYTNGFYRSTNDYYDDYEYCDYCNDCNCQCGDNFDYECDNKSD
jgi:hypothetical protein